MKDSDLQIFQAFLVALARQQNPLPDSIQAQINQLGDRPDSDAIDRLVDSYPPLQKVYSLVHAQLLDSSNHTRMGRDVLPDASFELENSKTTDVDNAASAIDDLTDLPTITEQIKQKIGKSQAQPAIANVCKSSDSVEQAKFILKFEFKLG
ncbi:hypothetical protein [Oxynema aestuarii]|jgi:hypothetical protein|uniref:Uncharacterized protein n=1 Tax=Oxynema aestuarii AP17 TaxID=2064643 RepID=A0A6H1U569_9CYAN|nr:hypothetical protein [Oxynema aestuarii]QIZ73183.1 hypothetical protein HCG48_23410 [Oxynema aestuarii AP17]RMH70721.1 MAG: hypothetical protein D6680_22935 [Cyanobacteria bacterium J007]